MAASRDYQWRDGGGGVIEVRFSDGRFFHRFLPEEPAPADVHLCDPDTYRVRYDFARWPLWRAEWRVTGPAQGLFDGQPLPAGRAVSAARALPGRRPRPRRLRGARRGAGAEVGRALPPDARLPRRPGAGAALHGDRSRARLRAHQGRRPGEALRLAAGALDRRHRHRGSGGALGAGRGLLGDRLDLRRRSSCRPRPRAGRSRSTRRRGGRRTCSTSMSPASRSGCATRWPQADIGPAWRAEPFLTVDGQAFNVRTVGASRAEPLPPPSRPPRRGRGHGRPVARGDRQGRRRLLPRHRLDGARRRRRDRGAARRDLRAGEAD